MIVCCVAVFLLASPADASRDLPDMLAPTIACPVADVADLDRNLPVRPTLPFFSAADIVALSYGYDGPDQLLSLTTKRGSVGHHLFQGLWTDPVTGIAYARNRWYDARTASWLSEDPMGAVDSPNLYAFVGWGPHVGRDPMGLECLGLFGDESLTCRETLHVPEGGIYSAYRQASEARRDPTSSAAVRGSMGLLQGLSFPAAVFEEYVWRGAVNTPHRIATWAESGAQDLVEGDAAQKSIGFSKYCIVACEIGALVIPASSEMRVVTAQAPGMIRRLGSGIRKWIQRNITGTADEFSLAARQGARGFSAEIGQNSPNHFSLGLDDVVSEGVIYRRTDLKGNVRPYIGKSKSEARYLKRQREEVLQYKKLDIDVDFRFEMVDRAEPGFSLGLTEESWIRLEGGPTNKSNPFGLLSNKRYEMNQQRYLERGGVIQRPEGSVGR